ncbi:MAG TPA: glycerophosphodiester phosphodiesterase family protein [Sphingomicrobium sp.]
MSKWTRSSRSRADPLDPGPAGFAHRGLHAGFESPENSIAAFEAALEIGAGIECDLRLTADAHVVVFHDHDAMRLCGSPHRISRSTIADVSALRVANRSIPTLTNLLELVGGRVPLLLEIKVDRNVRRLASSLRQALVDYGGPYGLMSFDPRIVRLIKTQMPDARRGLVIQDRLTPLRRRVAMRLADPHFIAVERAALAKPWVAYARAHLPVYSWTIRTAAERAQAEVHADALIWEDDGRSRA